MTPAEIRGIYTTAKEALEHFDIQTGGWDVYDARSYSSARSKAKELVHRTIIAILQAELERVEGEWFEDPTEVRQFAVFADGYNTALQDHADFIREQIKEIERI